MEAEIKNKYFKYPSSIPKRIIGGETSIMTDDKNIFTTVKVHLFMTNDIKRYDDE